MKHHHAGTRENVIACTSISDDVKDMFMKLIIWAYVRELTRKFVVFDVLLGENIFFLVLYSIFAPVFFERVFFLGPPFTLINYSLLSWITSSISKMFNALILLCSSNMTCSFHTSSLVNFSSATCFVLVWELVESFQWFCSFHVSLFTSNSYLPWKETNRK